MSEKVDFRILKIREQEASSLIDTGRNVSAENLINRFSEIQRKRFKIITDYAICLEFISCADKTINYQTRICHLFQDF